MPFVFHVLCTFKGYRWKTNVNSTISFCTLIRKQHKVFMADADGQNCMGFFFSQRKSGKPSDYLMRSPYACHTLLLNKMISANFLVCSGLYFKHQVGIHFPDKSMNTLPHIFDLFMEDLIKGKNRTLNVRHQQSQRN